MTEINNEMYALPYIEISATATQVRPYYRTDILEKYDINVMNENMDILDEKINTVTNTVSKINTITESQIDSLFSE